MSVLNVLRNRVGFALRESGQALERLGCVFQGINSFEEESEHMALIGHHANASLATHTARYLQ